MGVRSVDSKGLSGEVTFELRPKSDEEAGAEEKLGKEDGSNRGLSKCKGPEAGQSLACFRNTRKAPVA